MYNGLGDTLKEIRISAKDIAEILYGSGNITSERVMLSRAQEGIEIHQFWQNQYASTDQKEVFVKTEVTSGDIQMEVTGRIDGIRIIENELVLEEIKSTHMDLDMLEDDTYPAHMVQAKLYAYMYMLEHDLHKIKIILTYIDVEDKEFVQFEKVATMKTMETFFFKVIGQYIEWEKKIYEHEKNRLKSIEGLSFPFSTYRMNQRELMAMVYRNILDKGILYAIAPTGIGKTIATLFSSLKAINQPSQKIFYATAKNDGKTVALDTVKLLENNGLIAKTCEITAKDKMCLLKERDCDPDVCKYANGYYKRIYKAIDDLYQNESIFSKEIIREYGKKHKVCPFEYSLDISNYSDIILCDYNYVFDPRVHLIRYFEDHTYQPILLIDEAHNMVSRSREMYSASLFKSTFLELKDISKLYKPSPRRELDRILDFFEEVELDLLVDTNFRMKDTPNEALLQHLKRLLNKFDQILASEKKIPFKSRLMDLFFEVFQYVAISEFYNQEYVTLYEKEEQEVIISMKCLNASKFLLSTIKEYSIAATFFSATLDPIHYYKQLITDSQGEFVKLPSSFKQDHLFLVGVDSVSTRYADREDSIETICQVSKILYESKKGNYILFFPSYQYLNMVFEKLDYDSETVEIIRQTKDMSLTQRSDTIEMFKTASEKTQVGMFVMGGVFGESIDLIGDMLSGVVIVGVGLPQLSNFNNILRSHFDEEFKSGFDFAYTYPGLNKVIQAVGRVIRSETDRGIAILIDDRFNSSKYYSLYPKEWSHLKIINRLDLLKKQLSTFWRKQDD